ncbi:MAG: hypothetical protein A3K19_07770 [Lentisphaerae bacterium RIFOXYB12_FULL_65_16]|nr:MAG: hypothetical protein A3K18_07375 [Lentisphaerae bacterium RIFOXYA12_64_32]OGV87560.1 MAG: hypothetical protein A3K19_07770 [Lentisphaerae bacterium RIFOXYB12_FULL_65_16]
MIDPEICNGKPVLRGKHITAQAILEFLSAGETHAEILRQYPSLEPEDIQTCLVYATRLMGHHTLVKQIA